jgi:O-antigen/teichoic acid export membrane protein
MISVTKERTFRNISYSIISFAWPILIALVITPIIVLHFGVKEYGIYIFINTLISFAGLLDIGFASAVSKYIAEKQGSNDRNGLMNLFKTANSVFLIIGIIGALCISLSIFFGLRFFPQDLVSSYAVYIPAFIYGGILFFINSINSLHVLIPTAYQRFDIGAKIGILFITIQQCGILVVVLLGGSINTLFLLQVVIMACFYFVYKKFVKTILHSEEKTFLGLYGLDYGELKKCYSFGVVSFVNNLAGVSLTYLDRMIIPVFLGPSNLAYYSLPGSVTSKIPSFSITLSSVVFPMTSHFEGAGNRDMTKMLYIKSMRLITVISTAIALTFIAFAYQLLQFWINTDLAEKATTVLVVLSITNLLLAVINLLNNVLLGIGKLRALIVTSVSTAMINGILLVVLLPKYGIDGAAYAYLFALLPYAFLIYVTEKKYLGLAFRRKYYFDMFWKLGLVSGITYLIDVIFIVQYINNFVIALISAGFSTVIFLGMYYLFGFFEKEDVEDISAFLGKYINRLYKK